MVALGAQSRTFSFPVDAIQHDQGYCYAIRSSIALSAQSVVALVEDGRPLAPVYGGVGDVRMRGGGLNSFAGDLLFFSASDNGDPRSNGRNYAVELILLDAESAPVFRRPWPDRLEIPQLPLNRIQASSRLFLYGAGTLGRHMRHYLEYFGLEVAGFIDSEKSGVVGDVSLYALADYDKIALPDDVVILASSFRTEILELLAARGIKINLHEVAPPKRIQTGDRALSKRFQRLQQILLSIPFEFSRAAAYQAAECMFQELVPDGFLGEEEKLWWIDAGFIADMARLAAINGRAHERKFVIREFVRSIAGLSGDMSECGTFDGAAAYIMAKASAESGCRRSLHLFDSFEGLSRPASVDGSGWQEGELALPESVARRKLADFDKVYFYKGWIPNRFEEVADRQFAFVHVDVDLYQPTFDSYAFFYPRLVSGGVIICDDYGFTKCPGAWRAIEEFMADKPETVLHLPTGQGVIIKR